MDSYIGAKIIKAEPMTLTEYNSKHNKVVPATSGEEGYVVKYPDGYISWSPKSVFENAYRRITVDEATLMMDMEFVSPKKRPSDGKPARNIWF